MGFNLAFKGLSHKELRGTDSWILSAQKVAEFVPRIIYAPTLRGTQIPRAR